MNRELVETFLMVAECRNLTNAAGRLHVSQSSVSRRLATLEVELGVSLLSRGRGRRDVALTAYGEEFVYIARRWIALARETEDLRWSTPTRVLSIASVDLVNTHSFVPLYQQYVGREDVKLCINTHHSDEIHALVGTRSADLGFVFSEVHYPEIVSSPIFHERMSVLVRDDAPLPSRIEPAELAEGDEIYLRWGTDYELWHRRHWTPDRYRIRVNTGSMLIHYLMMEGSWAIVPRSEVQAMARLYPVRSVELTEPPPPRVCYQLSHVDPPPGQHRALADFSERLHRFIAESVEIEGHPSTAGS